jgi:hypothetical protein
LFLQELPDALCSLQLNLLDLTNNCLRRLPPSLGHMTTLRSIPLVSLPTACVVTFKAHGDPKGGQPVHTSIVCVQNCTAWTSITSTHMTHLFAGARKMAYEVGYVAGERPRRSAQQVPAIALQSYCSVATSTHKCVSQVSAVLHVLQDGNPLKLMRRELWAGGGCVRLVLLYWLLPDDQPIRLYRADRLHHVLSA